MLECRTDYYVHVCEGVVDEDLRLYTASDDATICVWDIKAERRVADRDKCLHTFRRAPRPASPGAGGSNGSKGSHGSKGPTGSKGSKGSASLLGSPR